ncbi:MAG: c-type cytochrome [Pseudomonadota bacterium]
MKPTLLAAAMLAAAAYPAHAADPVEGRKLARQCAQCHGLDGLSRIPIAPHIAGENEVYLRTQLQNFRSGKRQHEIMSIIAGSLSDAQIDDLSAWYASIEITVTMPE